MNIFKRVIANGVAFDYSQDVSNADCIAHAKGVMGFTDKALELHNHSPLGYCSVCADMEDEDDAPTEIRVVDSQEIEKLKTSKELSEFNVKIITSNPHIVNRIIDAVNNVGLDLDDDGNLHYLEIFVTTEENELLYTNTLEPDED